MSDCDLLHFFSLLCIPEDDRDRRFGYSRDETAATSALFFAALDVTILGYRNPVTSFTKAIDRILTDDTPLLRRIVGARAKTV
jgi:hypothetical protein